MAGLIIVGSLIVIGLVLIVVLGPIPGCIARDKHLEHAQTIHILGWVGAWLCFPLWVAALIWALAAERGIPKARINLAEFADPEVAKRAKQYAQRTDEEVFSAAGADDAKPN
jgi:hypothetical protein